MESAGLASSILTFIDISFKIVKGAHELYKSASGSTSENNHIANVVLDLEKASGYLSISQSGNKDTGLQSLVAQCQSLSRDLLELLDKLQVKDKTLFKSFAAAFANARKQKDIASIEHRLDHYRQQILLRLSLLFCQSQAPIRAQLESIRQESNRLQNKHASELEKTHAKMEEIIEALRGQQTDARPSATFKQTKESNQILDVLKFRGTGRGPTAPDIAVEGEAFRLNSQRSDASGGLADLANILSGLKPLYEAIRNENSVLSFLYFDDMFRREDTVRDASAETFAWMVQKPNPSDVELKQDGSSSDGESRRQGAASDETDSGSGQSHSSENSDVETSDADTFTRQERRRKLEEENLQRRMTSESFLSFLTAIGGGSYFITGKAGSGKSTLMKFLANHQRVAKHLADWSSGRKLIQVNIFFWNSGTALQKSLEGFYRTILFHTLRQSPELIEEIFPPFTGTYLTESTAKRSPNLVQAFDRLVRVGVCSNHAFCFFIDGLDEYEGDTLDQRDLAGKLLSWSRADYVKIICSGRPYTAFLDVFQSNNPFVKLEHLTRADILNFALSQFEHHLEDTAFDGVRSACIEKAEMITDKAEGVFLWASLVVRSLLNAALDYEDETQIVRLLDECPTDLNGLFRRMLSNINSSKTLRLRSNFIFNLVVQWWSESFGVNVLTLTWLSEFNWFQTASEFPFNVRKNPYDEQEIDRRVSIAQKQLHLLTQGLLEVENPGLRLHAPFFASRIGFFHRSVIDFLKNEWLPKLDCGPFESIQGQAEVFCRLKLAEVKFAPRALSQATGYSYTYDILNIYKHFFDTLSTLRLKYGYQVPLKYIEDIEKNGCGNVTEDEIHLPTPSNIGGSSIPVWLADVRSQNIRRLESMEMDTRVRLSILHMAIVYGEEEYVRWRLASSNPDSISLIDAPDTSILLSAYVSGNPGLVRWLHEKGLHPGDFIMGVSLSGGLPRHRISIWEAYLLRFANHIADHERSLLFDPDAYSAASALEKAYEVLELVLQAGADPSLRVLVDIRTKESRSRWIYDETDIISSHHIGIDQLVKIHNPKNEESLLKLLSEKQSASHFFKRKSFIRFARISKRSTEKTPPIIASFPRIGTEELARSFWSPSGILSRNGDRVVRDFITRDF